MARTPDPSEAEFVRRVREPRAASAEPGRHRARRSAMMVLYRTDLVGGEVDDAIASFEADNGFPMPEYTEDVVRGVLARLDELDAVIDTYLVDWTVDRLGAVERAVLRVAMWELFERQDVPGPVAIDEAVELAKRYATPEAAKLINGVLAAWLRDHDAEEGEEE
ncbi:MAG: transcription antitermination factor NusB [Thermoleophilia bacterium]|nr:transcription antitermination factor NusB [Thermoleophilia bacterium]